MHILINLYFRKTLSAIKKALPSSILSTIVLQVLILQPRTVIASAVETQNRLSHVPSSDCIAAHESSTNDVFCSIELTPPIHPQNPRRPVNIGQHFLYFKGDSPIQTISFALLSDSQIDFKFIFPTRRCKQPFFSLFYREDPIYQDFVYTGTKYAVSKDSTGIVSSDPFSEFFEPEIKEGDTDPTYGLPIVNYHFVLPSGKYSAQLELAADEQSACDYIGMISEGDRSPTSDDPQYNGTTRVTKKEISNKLASLIPAVARLRLGTTFNFSTLKIVEGPVWDEEATINFLDDYCSRNNEYNWSAMSDNPSSENSFAVRPINDPLRDVRSLNVDYSLRKSFFEANIRKAFRDGTLYHVGIDKGIAKRNGNRLMTNSGETEWIRLPAKVVCGTALKLEYEKMSIDRLIDILNGPNSIKYLVNVDMWPTARDKKAWDNIDLNTKILNPTSAAAKLSWLVGDILKVGVSRILYQSLGGNCTLEWTFGILGNGRGYVNCMLSDMATALIRPPENSNGTSVFSLASESSDLRSAIAKMLPDHASISWLQVYDDAVRVRVSGVKGWVQPQSPYWETFYITASLNGERERRRLTVLVDGVVASGAGDKPPSEASYIKSMDSVAGYKLADFANRIAVSVKEYLEKGR